MSFEITPEMKAKWAADRIAYEAQGKIALAECTMGVEEERFVMRHGPEVVYEEGRLNGYAETTAAILAGRKARWKTLAMFRTLRKAVREHWAQMMNIDLPRAGASRRVVMEFLVVARHYDKQHHGSPTF